MTYYVVYYFKNGIGSCNIEANKKISKYEDIKNVADYISKTWCNNENVIILNWKEIK